MIQVPGSSSWPRGGGGRKGGYIVGFMGEGLILPFTTPQGDRKKSSMRIPPPPETFLFPAVYTFCQREASGVQYSTVYTLRMIIMASKVYILLPGNDRSNWRVLVRGAAGRRLLHSFHPVETRKNMIL